MDENRVVERDRVTDDGVERREVVEKEYAPGTPSHWDEQAGGAVAGGLAGAAVGAVVGGPVGAVVGGAIGAANRCYGRPGRRSEQGPREGRSQARRAKLVARYSRPNLAPVPLLPAAPPDAGGQ